MVWLCFNILSSTECGLNFSSTPLNLEDTFQQITVTEEDGVVAKQQAEEDLRLYGSRPFPQDFDETQESTLLEIPAHTLKRTTSEYEADGSNRPAKIHKDGRSSIYTSFDGHQGASMHAKVTAMDWNSGNTPLDAWLNVSAVPSITPISLKVEGSTPQETEVASQEVDEIEVFRNIHIPLASGPCGKKDPLLPRLVGDLDYGTKIHYRNIMDKYPSLPVHLARRLAEANLKRAERLWSCRRDKKSDNERKRKPVQEIGSTVAGHTSMEDNQPIVQR